MSAKAEFDAVQALHKKQEGEVADDLIEENAKMAHFYSTMDALVEQIATGTAEEFLFDAKLTVTKETKE